jgi:hypothetical protein
VGVLFFKFFMKERPHIYSIKSPLVWIIIMPLMPFIVGITFFVIKCVCVYIYICIYICIDERTVTMWYCRLNIFYSNAKISCYHTLFKFHYYLILPVIVINWRLHCLCHCSHKLNNLFIILKRSLFTAVTYCMNTYFLIYLPYRR